VIQVEDLRGLTRRRAFLLFAAMMISFSMVVVGELVMRARSSACVRAATACSTLTVRAE